MLRNLCADIFKTGVAHISVNEHRIFVSNYIYDCIFYSTGSRYIRVTQTEVIYMIRAVDGGHLLAFFEHSSDDGAVLNIAFHFLRNHYSLLSLSSSTHSLGILVRNLA